MPPKDTAHRQTVPLDQAEVRGLATCFTASLRWTMDSFVLGFAHASCTHGAFPANVFQDPSARSSERSLAIPQRRRGDAGPNSTDAE